MTHGFRFRAFQSRHVGPDAEETAAMLKAVGAPSLDALIDQAIPARIRLEATAEPARRRERVHFLRELQHTAKRNQVFPSFLGLGTTTPSRRA